MAGLVPASGCRLSHGRACSGHSTILTAWDLPHRAFTKKAICEPREASCEPAEIPREIIIDCN
jgi:hypothetical protein